MDQWIGNFTATFAGDSLATTDGIDRDNRVTFFHASMQTCHVAIKRKMQPYAWDWRIGVRGDAHRK